MATVTEQGQVTIPKDVQEFLGIGPGSIVDFKRAPDGKIVLVPEGNDLSADRFTKLRGHAGPGLTTDEIMAMTRGEV